MTSDASPAAAPSPTRWRPTARTQWAVVGVTLAWVLAMAVLLPLWAKATAPEPASVDADGRASVADLSIEPAEGWILDPAASESIKLSKADARLLVFPATASTEAPESAVEATVEGFRADTSIAYQIGDIETFTTESGLAGASAVVLDPESATIVLAVSDGANLAQGLLTAKIATWDEIEEEALAMVRTLSFGTGAGQ